MTHAPDPAAAAGRQMVEIVDRDGRVVDVVTRAEMRRSGGRHRCTYVVVVRSNGAVVVHQRAGWKDVAPLAWDLAFGGVCDVGEGWAESARRELAEEAGLTGVALQDLGQVTWEGDGASLLGRVFLVRHDGPLAPADGEVVALDEVPLAALGDWMARTDVVDDSPAVVLPLLAARG
ncbi:hypothetical protein BH23ACT9_BH23ACT9_13010 [soil metagenome]